MAQRGKWDSKTGFILAAAGSAVGLGNIWRFPYTTGKNGGALFVLIYLIAVIVVALPILLAEVSVGRFTGKNPVGAFKKIRPKGGWKYVGYLGVLTGIMILSYYSVVAGWTVGYFFKSVAGKFKDLTPSASEQIFTDFTANPWLQILLLVVFMGLTVYVVSRGVSSGIEKFAKILMPLLMGILVLMLVRSLTLPTAEGAPGVLAGLAFYLKPDFSAINPGVILEAMGQAFFSLSLGMGAMITYGSYVSKGENLSSSAAWIAFFDTFIAIMAGFIIFPALFSQGMSPVAEEGLVFNVFPVIFAQIPGGFIFGPFFFLLLSIAALTSTISLLEVVTAYCIDEKRWNRKRAAVLVGIFTLLFGIPSALSVGGVEFFTKLPVVNMSFLGLWNLIWGNLSLMVGAFFLAIFVGWVWKSSNALMEISKGSERFKFAFLWVISIKFISPILIIVILLGKIL